MKNYIAIVTVIFDYQKDYLPTFYNNAIKYFDKNDIHIVRSWNKIENVSYYDKLFYYKIIDLLEYIKKYIEGKYEYILFLDATDTNFIKPPNNIFEDFKHYDCSILMGAEYGLWPPTIYSKLYDNKIKFSDKFYLNSGTYIGYTDKIIFHLKNIIEKNYQEGIDDQGKWTIEYLLNDDIKIDQECKIFFSTFLSKKDIIINQNNIHLKNINACIIHDNGPDGENTYKLTNFF